MDYSDFLLFCSRHGFPEFVKKSCYRKYCRRNKGKKFSVKTRFGNNMNVVIGDSVDNEIFINGQFELGTSEVMAKLARYSDCLIDVGCNIGYYSALFGFLNKNATVFPIDPNPQMIDRCVDNLMLNRIEKYKPYNLGVSSEGGILDFYINKRRHSLGSFIEPSKDEKDEMNVIKVDVKSLCDIVSASEIEKAVLKIDAEGYEWKILSGLQPEYVEKIDYIIFEFFSEHIANAEKYETDIFEIPWVGAYEMFDILRDGTVQEFKFEAGLKYSTNLLMVRRGAQKIDSMR